MFVPRALFLPALFIQLGAQSPIQVGQPLPPLLDLRQVDLQALVPKDPRDPAMAEKARQAWAPILEPQRGRTALRLLLPVGEGRLPLLLAASQALRAQNPELRLFLAFDPAASSLWDPSAWGALHGGILAPEDLGQDTSRWRDLLVRAQEQLPGRTWFLWVPVDPGAKSAVLLGDGGRLVVPEGGASARLAAAIPAGFKDVEGGLGDLTLHHRESGQSRRWRFESGEWRPAELPKERYEVSVTAKDLYDVPALLAKMRATHLRDRGTVRNLSAAMDVDLHIQSPMGPGSDLGFSFDYFETMGETEEVLQKEVRFNGVRAKVKGELQLPIIESRASVAPPVVLSLTERYRYSDGGPEGAGRRLVRFEPVDRDATLFRGELLVDEATGRILEERSERSDLPGTVRSERRTVIYGDVSPDSWRIAKVDSFERWVTPKGMAQVNRRYTFSNFRVNDPDFLAAREKARDSKGTMLKQTLDGMRYYTRQADGSRRITEKQKTSGRGMGAFLLVDPSLPWPVVPLGGFAYFDFNAFDRGAQLNFISAIVFNQASLMIPKAFAGFDLGFSGTAMLLSGTERPVHNGKLSDREGVGRSFGNMNLRLSRDLGLGFRIEAEGRFEYDRFREAREEQYRTPGFALPPSGWTRVARGELSWLYRGFQVEGYYSAGKRPDGSYGTIQNPQEVPEQGKFKRWGGTMGYDQRLGSGFRMHVQGGYAGGRGFDRFRSIGLSGLMGEVRVAGIRSNAITADQVLFGQAGLVLPPVPNLRLTLNLDHARARSLDDRKTYGFTGLNIAGDIPGFWWFTTVRLDLGVGLHSDIPGMRTVNGWVALLKVF